MEVNSLRSWKLKWTLPFAISGSIVLHEVHNFLRKAHNFHERSELTTVLTPINKKV